MQIFSLQRFDPVPDTASLRVAITGTARRRDNILSLDYLVTGGFGGLAVPEARGPCRRRHELWRHTCFECFIAIQEAEEYWEVNLAPNGDWNVYHFDRYRTGMAEVTAISRLPSMIDTDGDGIRVGMTIDLSPIIREEVALEVGITAVLEHRHGALSYWALRHRGTKADFHHRAGFGLAL
ncbi:DOMON-like domain-containing protein [Desulfoprunum benzoelyticum]|uniref:DOMON-like domain-containing protein n=1 Tax=Desulfoprunum benzoelyticum TaxID=1506996 RepID=A0A840UM80_9BACT|nr:DOMON-like domain-containing protein [Desulfoprunum benzoelyticum]MBB5347397.1 hypothetical protein [Desulfoprunum benzoelyticum]MBM9530925.1 DOMON-like domain-containing protein [Desulfoprunum benzoelyticum]